MASVEQKEEKKEEAKVEKETYELFLPDSGCGIVHTWFVAHTDKVEEGQKLGEGESAESVLVPIICPRSGVVEKLIPVGRHVKERYVRPVHSDAAHLQAFFSSIPSTSPLLRPCTVFRVSPLLLVQQSVLP